MQSLNLRKVIPMSQNHAGSERTFKLEIEPKNKIVRDDFSLTNHSESYHWSEIRIVKARSEGGTNESSISLSKIPNKIRNQDVLDLEKGS